MGFEKFRKDVYKIYLKVCFSFWDFFRMSFKKFRKDVYKIFEDSFLFRNFFGNSFYKI